MAHGRLRGAGGGRGHSRLERDPRRREAARALADRGAGIRHDGGAVHVLRRAARPPAHPSGSVRAAPPQDPGRSPMGSGLRDRRHGCLVQRGLPGRRARQPQGHRRLAGGLRAVRPDDQGLARRPLGFPAAGRTESGADRAAGGAALRCGRVARRSGRRSARLPGLHASRRLLEWDLGLARLLGRPDPRAPARSARLASHAGRRPGRLGADALGSGSSRDVLSRHAPAHGEHQCLRHDRVVGRLVAVPGAPGRARREGPTRRDGR